MRPTQLAGRRVTVMGLGLFGGGAAVVRFLVRAGADVTVTDLRPAELLAPILEELASLPLRLVLGRHEDADFRGAELIVANPAVPPSSRYLELARDAGVPITSEVALFLERAPSRLLAVTGTQGKSTTCHLLAGLLLAAGKRAHLGGNIGRSLLDGLEELGPEDVCVLELSSYQLELLPAQLAGRRPFESAAIVNVLADHLERHGDLASYRRAKLRLVELVAPGGSCIVGPGATPAGGDSAWPAEVRRIALEGAGGRDLELGDGTYRLDGELLAGAADLALPGDFQHANALAALGLARLAGAARELLGPGLRGLRGLPHRLESLEPVDGRPVWDNGVSTTPDSTASALLALPSGLTLLCGGAPKALPLEPLLDAARERARRVIVFGAAAHSWTTAFRAAGVEAWPAEGVEQAVELALSLAEPGQPLLFSPAAASFDAHANFRARAEVFRLALARAVDALRA